MASKSLPNAAKRASRPQKRQLDDAQVDKLLTQFNTSSLLKFSVAAESSSTMQIA